MIEMALPGHASQMAARRQADASTSFASGFSVEVLTGPGAYTDVRSGWNALANRQPGVVCFQSADLLAVWARHYAGDSASLRTVVVRDGRRPVLIWPLEVCRKGPVRIASAAGAPVAQYDDMFVDPDCDTGAAMALAMAAVADTIRPDLLKFSNLRTDGWLIRALGDEAIQVESEGASFVDISGGIEAVRAGLKTRVRQQQRKRMQKFAAAGQVGFAVAGNGAEAEAWLDDLLALKRKWLVGTGRISRAFTDSRTTGALRDLARSLSDPAASPRLLITKVTLDDTIAAMEVGFIHRSAYHLYIRSFAEELGRFGPGHVVTEKAIEWCAGIGLQRYDMMAPRSRNKSEWQSGEMEVSDRILPLTRMGAIYAATITQRLAPALRDGFYRLPDRWRSAIADRRLKI